MIDVPEIDLSDPAVLADPFTAYGAARERGPVARLVTPGAWELATVFRRLSAGVRYFAPMDGPGRPSYALMCRGKDYDLARLSSNTRSKVRRGLSRCTVGRL